MSASACRDSSAQNGRHFDWSSLSIVDDIAPTPAFNPRPGDRCIARMNGRDVRVELGARRPHSKGGRGYYVRNLETGNTNVIASIACLRPLPSSPFGIRTPSANRRGSSDEGVRLAYPFRPVPAPAQSASSPEPAPEPVDQTMAIPATVANSATVAPPTTVVQRTTVVPQTTASQAIASQALAPRRPAFAIFADITTHKTAAQMCAEEKCHNCRRPRVECWC
jgi:hypothetical protein